MANELALKQDYPGLSGWPVSSQVSFHGRGMQGVGQLECEKDATPAQCESRTCLQMLADVPWEGKITSTRTLPWSVGRGPLTIHTPSATWGSEQEGQPGQEMCVEIHTPTLFPVHPRVLLAGGPSPA